MFVRPNAGVKGAEIDFTLAIHLFSSRGVSVSGGRDWRDVRDVSALHLVFFSVGRYGIIYPTFHFQWGV